MFTDDLEQLFGSTALALAVCLPLALYLLNYFTLGERLQFRVLSFFCVAFTALVIAGLNASYVVPLRVTAHELRGGTEDTDPMVLGALLSGFVLAVIGTVPTALFHLLIKARKRRERKGGATGAMSPSSKTAAG